MLKRDLFSSKMQSAVTGCKVLGLLAVLSLSGCGERDRSQATPIVRLDGSSTVFPVAEAVAEEFQLSTGGKIRVTVGISGTGGGFKKFVRNEVDIQNASRPILSEEMALARENGVRYIEVPICYDAITVVVHPGNTWAKEMKVSELKKIWEPAAQEKITHWNQIRPEWPDEEIVLFGPGADSGTFDYFTEAIVGKAKSSRGDFTGSEDDNVLVQGVAGNRFALGYIPFAYYEPHRDIIQAVSIAWDLDTHTGEALDHPAAEPSLQAVVEGRYNPLARPLFVYIRESSLDDPSVAQFVDFYLKNGAALAREVNYLPLPDSAYTRGLEKVRDRITGTAFAGTALVGASVEEILARENVE